MSVGVHSSRSSGHHTATAGDPHVVRAVGVDAVEVDVGVGEADLVPRRPVIGDEDALVAVDDMARADPVEVDSVDG